MSPPATRQPWYRILYVQVLIGVALGVAIGYFFPSQGKALQPLGDGFIKLVKMIIAPIIFCTVTHGIAGMSDMKKLGRVGGKALLYFEIVSTIALVIGLVVVNTLHPGVGFQGTPDAKAIEKTREYIQQAHSLNTVTFLLNIIPVSFFDALAKGDLLQVLLIAILTAFAISALGERGRPILHGIERAAEIFFGIMRIVVRLAPLGALGAMAYTIGSYGLSALGHLLALMLSFYLTAAFFVFVVLGSIARGAGFSIFRFIAYIKEELWLVLGTSSSETALPGMIRKMRALGCAESTVGLVIPTGYSFNLDGTNIYMTMATVFLAQATNTHMDLRQQITLLLVAMLSSKGSSGVTGAGFITLAATISAVPGIPVESLAIIYGIERFMSECRSLTNLVGNGVATVVVSRWEKEVTPEQLRVNMEPRAAPASPLEVPEAA
jgi:aerobic C4-dicarboxylate transport protein